MNINSLVFIVIIVFYAILPTSFIELSIIKTWTTNIRTINCKRNHNFWSTMIETYWMPFFHEMHSHSCVYTWKFNNMRYFYFELCLFYAYKLFALFFPWLWSARMVFFLHVLLHRVDGQFNCLLQCDYNLCRYYDNRSIYLLAKHIQYFGIFI